MRDNKIVHVVDLGCGDWPFSRMMDWNGVEYLGLDLVESVIARNRQEYTTANIHFQVISGDLGDLPAADLLIAKDVLQHWSNASVASFLPVLRRYRFSLITNCVNPKGATLNEVIIVGDFRFLDLRLPPFNVHAEEIFSFVKHRPFWARNFRTPRWKKKVLLIRSYNALGDRQRQSERFSRVASDSSLVSRSAVAATNFLCMA